ncbi:thioredoxin [Chishuiella changwenlii]|jgi:thioredoxin 1|uniref:Thioredoxin n=1 Tax=Chishuiella changwenlii TaxID=1434701 RepID=A0A1M6ZFD9_9FLAO|nr:thioredoxin [Chishuiella changwenlii]GGE86173.1 thioredoxin [Chishuiella changwenlii]SHL29089.1 thioredoxin [Chishuiella changwenlii]
MFKNLFKKNNSVNQEQKTMTFEEIIDSEQPILLDFFATWCGPCQMMGPILQQVKEELGDEVKILKVDIDKYRDLAAKYQVQSVPTFAIFKNSQLLWKESGAKPKEYLVNELKKHI